MLGVKPVCANCVVKQALIVTTLRESPANWLPSVYLGYLAVRDGRGWVGPGPLNLSWKFSPSLPPVGEDTGSLACRVQHCQCSAQEASIAGRKAAKVGRIWTHHVINSQCIYMAASHLMLAAPLLLTLHTNDNSTKKYPTRFRTWCLTLFVL